jgi:hypothetical protein
MTEDKPKLLLNFDLWDEALVMLFLASYEDPEDRKAVHAMRSYPRTAVAT